MRAFVTLALAAACVLCACSIARTLNNHYRQGYVGSAVLFMKVVQESGADLFREDEPIKPVRLSDLATVKPANGGGE